MFIQILKELIIIQNTKNNKLNIKRLIALVTLIIIIISSIAISFTPDLNLPFDIPEWHEIFKLVGLRNSSEQCLQPFSVHFIDVGQGDCILIKTEHGNTLIDAGDIGNSENIIRYLKNMNIYSLDYIIISHPDLDHIGSMSEIINEIRVSKIILPNINKENLPSTRNFEDLLNIISKSKALVYAANFGDEYLLGNAKMKILGPITQSSNLNNMSAVLRVEYGNTSFLFTGDAEEEEENDIIKSGENIKSDVLKAGHHGSKNSSGAEFLNKVLPSDVIISCGKDNLYGHPNSETLDRFKTIGAKVFRTDKVGIIVLTSDGEKITRYFQNCKIEY